MIIDRSQQDWSMLTGLGYVPVPPIDATSIPIKCAPTEEGHTTQMYPDGLCHEVFSAADYLDPAKALVDKICLDPNSHCVYNSQGVVTSYGGVPASAQPYQVGQPTTQAMLDANKIAQGIFSNQQIQNTQSQQIANATQGGGSLLSSISNISLPFGISPMMLLLGGSGLLLLVTVLGSRGR